MRLSKIQILHCTTGSSDKVYILELLEGAPPDQEKYTLVASWGPRTRKRLSSQIKIEGEPKWVAQEEFSRIFQLKKRAGYNAIPFDKRRGEPEDLEIPGYRRKFEKQYAAYTTSVSLPVNRPTEDSLTRNML